MHSLALDLARFIRSEDAPEQRCTRSDEAGRVHILFGSASRERMNLARSKASECTIIPYFKLEGVSKRLFEFIRAYE